MRGQVLVSTKVVLVSRTRRPVPIITRCSTCNGLASQVVPRSGDSERGSGGGARRSVPDVEAPGAALSARVPVSIEPRRQGMNRGNEYRGGAAFVEGGDRAIARQRARFDPEERL